MPSTLPPSESINRRFRYLATLVYLMVVALVLALFAAQWQGYRDAREAKKEFNVLRAALGAMADVSSERRPTYAVSVLGEPEPQPWVLALRTARHATDARMDELEAALRDPECGNCVAHMPTWERAHEELLAARGNLDAIIHRPRTDEALLDGFARLSGVIPQLSSIAEIGALGVVRQNADVQSYLLVARLSGLLREQAGMIVSQFGPAIVSRRALSDKELFEIALTRGRIEQLRSLLLPSIRVLPPGLQSDYAELDRRYFGEAIALLERVQQQVSRPDGVPESPIKLTETYGALITPINQFRDDALMLAGNAIDDRLRWYLVHLIASGIFAAVLTGMLLLIIWRFRERIIQPVAEARQFILAIASGDASAELPREPYGNEMRQLFGALNVLKHNDAKRLQLELERQRLIEELQTMAETDALTGLLNRRALESRARVLLADQRGSDSVIALMMLDIDRFKRVNDTYGHESGDKALVMLATVCRETVRSDDIVARFGGEEFVILLRVRALEVAHALAESIRLRLHDETVVATDGQSFGFTVSIGLASARREAGRQIDMDALFREADAQLYRAKQNGRDRTEVAPAA